MDDPAFDGEFRSAEYYEEVCNQFEPVGRESRPFLIETRDEFPATSSDSPIGVAAKSHIAGRILDIAVASVLLLLTLPLMAFCALAVLISSPGPLLFIQKRIGQSGRDFSCLKFRTMITDAESGLELVLGQCGESQEQWAAVQKLKADPRVTGMGRFLRRYCFDELPQLFNVLKGDMSIVGPRPIVSEEISKYGLKFSDYCSVRPGLTGLWQVSGRHALSYDQRVRLDAEYVRSKSVRGDLLILLRTVPVVLFGENE